eukprot:785566-Amphidinium_carterae.2
MQRRRLKEATRRLASVAILAQVSNPSGLIGTTYSLHLAQAGLRSLCRNDLGCLVFACENLASSVCLLWLVTVDQSVVAHHGWFEREGAFCKGVLGQIPFTCCGA